MLAKNVGNYYIEKFFLCQRTFTTAAFFYIMPRMDLKTLYSEILNEHNIRPSHKGTMDEPSLVLRGVNPSCGDDIYLQLKIGEDGTITDGSFSGSGCAISQASVDMMLDNIIGRSKEDALRLADSFMGMIQGKELSDKELEDLDEAAALQNISHMPARVKCAVLGWHTMQEMLRGGKDSGSGHEDHCSPLATGAE